MSQDYNTRFYKSDGTDLGRVLMTREYLLSVYPNVANQFVTPELWAWGGNYTTYLGIDHSSGRLTPVTTFSGGSNWKQVSVCGNNGTSIAAIKSDGTLWTWGLNYYGQLGINSTVGRSTPITTLAGGTNWKQVSVGGAHVAAIKTDGTLWVWGDNQAGQLGINNLAIVARSTPVTTFAGGTNWKQVSCNGLNMAAIKTDGTLWVWGGNLYGQLGNNDVNDRSTPITTFAGGTNWKQVSVGGDHVAAIKSDGTLWTWGSGNSGRLGNNQFNNISTPVTTFAGGTNWKQVSCGILHMAAIKTDGTLWTWGSNFGGALGINDNNPGGIRTPVTTFAGGTNWRNVDGSTSTVSAIKTDGTLWVWGAGTYGELGNNRIITLSTPVTTFLGGNNWIQASAGISVVAAIRSSEEL